MTTLEVLICTIDDGIERAMDVILPKPIEGVRWLIAWQMPPTEKKQLVQPLLERGDVTIIISQSIGLCRNRNIALRHATQDICIIADDDLAYTPEDLAKIRNAYDNRENADMILFKYRSKICPKDSYPKGERDLKNFHRIHNYYPVSFEITFRREAILKSGISFNEEMGLGAGFVCAGEEAIFLRDAIRAGLNCRFVPQSITTHVNAMSHITRMHEPAYVRSIGVSARVFYPEWILRLFVLAARISIRNEQNYFKTLRLLWQGADFAKKKILSKD